MGWEAGANPTWWQDKVALHEQCWVWWTLLPPVIINGLLTQWVPFHNALSLLAPLLHSSAVGDITCCQSPCPSIAWCPHIASGDFTRAASAPFISTYEALNVTPDHYLCPGVQDLNQCLWTNACVQCAPMPVQQCLCTISIGLFGPCGLQMYVLSTLYYCSCITNMFSIIACDCAKPLHE